VERGFEKVGKETSKSYKMWK